MADNGIATTDNNGRLDTFKQLARHPAARQLMLPVAVAGANISASESGRSRRSSYSAASHRARSSIDE